MSNDRMFILETSTGRYCKIASHLGGPWEADNGEYPEFIKELWGNPELVIAYEGDERLIHRFAINYKGENND